MNSFTRTIIGVCVFVLVILVSSAAWRWSAHHFAKAKAWTRFCDETSRNLGDHPLHASASYRRGLIHVDDPTIQRQIPNDHRAATPQDCGTLVFVSETQSPTGQKYTNGASGFRRTLTLRVVDCEKNAVTAERSFVGEAPPKTISKSSTKGLGRPPAANQMADWIMSLSEGPPNSVSYGGKQLLRMQHDAGNGEAYADEFVHQALSEIEQHGNADDQIQLLEKFLEEGSDDIVRRVLTLVADCEWQTHPIREKIIGFKVGSNSDVRLKWLALMEQLPSDDALAFKALHRFLLTANSQEEGVIGCRAIAAHGDQALPVLTQALEIEVLREGALPALARLITDESLLNEETKNDLAIALYGVYKSDPIVASTFEQGTSDGKQRALATELLRSLGYSPFSFDAVLGPQWQQEKIGWSATALSRSSVPLKGFSQQDGFREQVAISGQGAFVAAASADRVYLASSGLQQLFQYEYASRASLESIAFGSKEDVLVATYADTPTSQAWSTGTGVATQGPSWHRRPSRGVVDQGVATFTTTDGIRKIQFPGTQTPDRFGFATAAEMAPGRRFLVIGTSAGFLCFLDTKHGELVQSLPIAGTAILDVNISDDGSHIAALLDDRIEVLSTSDEVDAKELGDFSVRMTPAKPAEDDPIFVTWGKRNPSGLFEKIAEDIASELALEYRVDDGEWKQQRFGQVSIGPLPFGVHTIQSRVRSVLGGTSEVTTEEIVVGRWVERIFPNVGRAFPHPVVSGDGSLLVLASTSDQEVLMWDIGSGQSQGRIELNSRPVRFATGPGGLTSIVTETGRFVVLDKQGAVLPETKEGAMISGQVASVAHSPRYIVFGVKGDNVIQARPMIDDNRIEMSAKLWPKNYDDREYRAQTVVWLPTADTFFGCDHYNIGSDYTVWDPAEPTEKLRIRWQGLPEGRRLLQPINLLVAGRLLAVPMYGGIFFFEPERGDNELRLVYQGDLVLPTGSTSLAHVDLASDGTQVLTVTKLGKVELWSVDPPSLIRVVADEGYGAAVFGRGGETIVLIGNDGSVAIRSYEVNK